MIAPRRLSGLQRERMIDYDLELRHHNDVLRRTHGIRASDRVLDIGCGTGQTTREAARLATVGAVLGLGIDRSDAMIKRARALARAARLRNVDHECADVERHALPPPRSASRPPRRPAEQRLGDVQHERRGRL
jgi:SAM-dependent methyltransferase